MEDYQYQSLNTAAGEFNDQLAFEITHTDLPITSLRTHQRPSKKELEATLPPGWALFANPNGRYFFERNGYTSYLRPDSTPPLSLYEGYQAREPGTFQVVSDAYCPSCASGEALLRPLPETWRLCFGKDGDGYEQPSFFDGSKRRNISDDPRLGSLPREWQPVQR